MAKTRAVIIAVFVIEMAGIGWAQEAKPKPPTRHLVTSQSQPVRGVLRQPLTTLHEGTILYGTHWNFLVRAEVEAQTGAERFFPDYDADSTAIRTLLGHAGIGKGKPRTEEEIWQQIGRVWEFLRTRVRVDNDAYGTLVDVRGGWPDIATYADYFERHGELVWAACFSKAHLFANLLGRSAIPRDRIALASTHHTEGGAPPTATHVYVAVYVADRWFYLDPTAVFSAPFPDFGERHSVGAASMTSVDYQHPYKVLPLPGSTLTSVPYLPP